LPSGRLDPLFPWLTMRLERFILIYIKRTRSPSGNQIFFLLFILCRPNVDTTRALPLIYCFAPESD